MRQTTLRRDEDGTVWKFCNGHCERPLTVDKFGTTSKGYVQSWCYDCRRIEARERYRAKYKNNWAFKGREQKRSRLRYQTDSEYRDRKLARDRARRVA